MTKTPGQVYVQFSESSDGNFCLTVDQANAIVNAARPQIEAEARASMVVKAKPLDWLDHNSKEWEEQTLGFFINLEDGDSPYFATWGESEVGDFTSLDEAKAACQNEADNFMAKHCALAASKGDA